MSKRLSREERICRFWARVEKTADCWIWFGSKTPEGYGRFLWDGKLHGVHRISLFIIGIDIPPGKCVDHLCRNPACVRPDHLEIVSYSVNISRGIGPMQTKQIKAAQTHCKHGHEFISANMRIRSNGWRDCMVCQKAATKRYGDRRGRKTQ